MDPLTSFAAAGNVLQFIQLGISLIRKTIEYSRFGGYKEHEKLQAMAQQLLISNAHLQESLDLESARLGSPGPARALFLANEECRKLSLEFVELIKNLNLGKPGISWRNLRHALESVRKRNDLDQMMLKMDYARSNLMLCLMVYAESKTVNHQQTITSERSEIIKEAQSVARTNEEVFLAIQSLAQQLNQLHISEADISRTLQQASDRIQEDLQLLGNGSLKILRLLSRENDEFTVLSNRTHNLTSIMENEILPKRRILQSLRFSRMHSRRSRISRAHGQTYQWIFKPKSSHPMDHHNPIVWDDFHEWLCDQETTNVYWISGKPGSGKTTLMREIEEQIEQQEALQRYIGNRDFIKASCYFWWAGNAIERSLSGLLRTLAHEFLEQRPDIMEHVVSSSRWQSAQLGKLQMPEWEDAELITMIKESVSLLSNNCQLLLLVDGLDEFEGTDEERERLIVLLRCFAQIRCVKVCVASRPWNIFRDSFCQMPQLRLEDLTKGDIELYVRENLEKDNNFEKIARQNPNITTQLTRDIVIKAWGVFLWVRLVVRDLLRVVRDGGGRKQLFRELERIPTDLDEYFEHMIKTIPITYRKEASMLLQISLCNLDYSLGTSKELISAPDLLLVQLEYLDEDTDPAFATKPDFEPIDYSYCHRGGDDYRNGTSEIQDLLERLERKLSSRCMGLLELGQESRVQGQTIPLWSRIEFMHRTVKDFLLTPSAQHTLQEFTGPDFDAPLYRCGFLIAHVKSLARGYVDRDRKFEATLCCLKNLIVRTKSSEASFLFFEEAWELLSRFGVDFDHWLQDRKECALEELISRRHIEKNCALSLAVMLGWKPYIESRLTAKCVREKKGRPLLDYALCMSWKDAGNPDPWIVTKLLQKGADPNEVYWNASIFTHFLVSVQRVKNFDAEACLQVLCYLIRASPKINLSSDEFQAGCRLALGPAPNRWELPSRASTERDGEGIGDKTQALSLGDALRSLSRIETHGSRNPHSSGPLFTPRELNSLDRALEEALAAQSTACKRRRPSLSDDEYSSGTVFDDRLGQDGLTFLIKRRKRQSAMY